GTSRSSLAEHRTSPHRADRRQLRQGGGSGHPGGKGGYGGDGAHGRAHGGGHKGRHHKQAGQNQRRRNQAQAQIHRGIDATDGLGGAGKTTGQQKDQQHGHQGGFGAAAHKVFNPRINTAARQQQSQHDGRQNRDRRRDFIKGKVSTSGLKVQATANKGDQK